VGSHLNASRSIVSSLAKQVRKEAALQLAPPALRQQHQLKNRHGRIAVCAPSHQHAGPEAPLAAHHFYTRHQIVGPSAREFQSRPQALVVAYHPGGCDRGRLEAQQGSGVRISSLVKMDFGVKDLRNLLRTYGSEGLVGLQVISSASKGARVPKDRVNYFPTRPYLRSAGEPRPCFLRSHLSRWSICAQHHSGNSGRLALKGHFGQWVAVDSSRPKLIR
jgi:hypothetical protein